MYNLVEEFIKIKGFEKNAQRILYSGFRRTSEEFECLGPAD
jgi:hypothetical protein